MTTWKMKIDEETKAPVVDGQKIVYIDPNGKELPLDPVSMYQKISELNGENQKHRQKYEEYTAKITPFKDIEDIAAWKEEAEKAIATVKNFNDKDWMKAEKVEALKADMSKAYEEKMKQKELAFQAKEKAYSAEKEKLDFQIRSLLVTNKFASSNYFSGDGSNKNSLTILPSKIAEDHFGKHFKVENTGDRLITKAYYSNGDAVISQKNPGEPADFDEAIGLILDQYPGKEGLLRSTSGGSGGTGGSGDSGENTSYNELNRQYKEATKAGDGKLAIVLKNRMFAAQKKSANG